MKTTRRRAWLATLALAVASLCPAPEVRAGATDPVLAIHGAAALAGSQRLVLVIDGAFPGADIVQLAYPMQVFVRALGGAGHYVRFDMSAGPFSGADASLGAELSVSEAEALLLSGAPEPDAQVVRIEPDRLVLALPPSFPAGDAEVQLFVADGGTVLLSNAWPLSLAEVAP